MNRKCHKSVIRKYQWDLSRPKGRLGQVVPSEMLCVDHLVVDGAPAARFAGRFKELVESGYGLEGV